jgi:hypothetical protein
MGLSAFNTPAYPQAFPVDRLTLKRDGARKDAASNVERAELAAGA